MADFTATNQQVFEFRGVDSLYIAKVTKDDLEGYTCDTPIYLSPVAEIAKATDSASEAHYYDNKAMIVVNSESADTVTITMAPPVLEKLALIIGKSFDNETGMMVDGERVNDYWAIMYRTKGTDGKYRYVTRLKGQFNIPEEDNQTENDGTDTTNTQIEYTGIYTEYQFTKGKFVNGSWEKGSAKGIVVDTRYNLADVTNYFNSVQTPDTIQPIAPAPAVTGIGVTPSSATVEAGGEVQLVATLSPAGATGTVTWETSDDTIATVDENGKVSALAEGSATITATCGSYTDTCAVTVEAAG